MSGVIIPIIAVHRNSFFLELSNQFARALLTNADIVIAGYNVPFDLTVLVQIPLVVQVRHIIGWTIEIDFLIVIPVSQICYAVRPAQRDHFVYMLREFQRIIHRQISAKTGAGKNNEVVLIGVTNKRQQLVSYVMFPGVVTHHAIMRVNIFVVPAVASFAVGAVNLNETLIDFITQGIDHQKILPLCEGSE
jgi:hypothetical protein